MGKFKSSPATTKNTKEKITEQEIDNHRNNQIEFLSLRNFVKYFPSFWGINNNNNCCVCVCVCGARRRPLAPGWWLVWVPPGVIVARPRAIASSSCCLLTIAGKEKVGGSSPNELLAACGNIWKKEGGGAKCWGGYYIGATHQAYMYNNLLPCGVAIFTRCIYTGASTRTGSFLFFVVVVVVVWSI
jgi:hypothetical protein